MGWGRDMEAIKLNLKESMDIVYWSVYIIYINVLLRKWSRTLKAHITVLLFPSIFSFCTFFSKAQKELLDAELDFHKRLSSGEDTTELRKKLNQLQVEVSFSGLVLLMYLWYINVLNPFKLRVALYIICLL